MKVIGGQFKVETKHNSYHGLLGYNIHYVNSKNHGLTMCDGHFRSLSCKLFVFSSGKMCLMMTHFRGIPTALMQIHTIVIQYTQSTSPSKHPFFLSLCLRDYINKGLNDMKQKNVHYYTYFCLSIIFL